MYYQSNTAAALQLPSPMRKLLFCIPYRRIFVPNGRVSENQSVINAARASLLTSCDISLSDLLFTLMLFLL